MTRPLPKPKLMLYDFNDPPNEAGFYEAVIQPEQEIHRGDLVYLRDLSEPSLGKMCRVRTLVAVLEIEEKA